MWENLLKLMTYQNKIRLSNFWIITFCVGTYYRWFIGSYDFGFIRNGVYMVIGAGRRRKNRFRRIFFKGGGKSYSSLIVFWIRHSSIVSLFYHFVSFSRYKRYYMYLLYNYCLFKKRIIIYYISICLDFKYELCSLKICW